MSIADRMPRPGSYMLERPAAELATISSTDFEGSVTERRGYLGLDVAEDVTMVMLPDLVTVTTNDDGSLDVDAYIAAQGNLVDWCDKAKTRMAILDVPPSLDATGARAWLARLARTSPFAAAYYPQLVIANPLARAGSTNGERFLTVPPCGHVAGVWADVDARRGVWKAPANEPVRGVVRLENDVTTGEQDLLNPEGINCIRVLRDQGIRIWGARTLATVAQPDWRYIPIRRTFTFIESSVQRAIAWAVFEPHDQDLRERVKRTIRSFLLGIWRQGGLVGATPDNAFFVVCDPTNNPADSVAAGRLVVDVGICPVRPAEFVIFRITQWDGGSETND
jgi:phage tail sheath protein FI